MPEQLPERFVFRKWDRQVIEAVLPDLFNEVKCETANEEGHRYRLLCVQGFLLKFYLKVCEKLSRKQVRSLLHLLKLRIKINYLLTLINNNY
jgi:hypothetical protein